MFKKIFIFAFLALALTFAFNANAATISLLTSKTNISAGDKLRITVKINSNGDSINAAQATIKFPADIIQVESVSKESSVFNFWLEEPVFDNSAGTISFIGGSASGYTGQSLTVLNIDFKVVSNGNANLIISGGAVTASDGKGTNVLNSVYGINLIGSGEVAAPTVTIPESAVPVATTLVESQPTTEVPVILPPMAPIPAPQEIVRTVTKATALPEAPKIEIPFYPDSDKWYNNSANFLVKWNLPSDINKVATAFNKEPDFNPKIAEGLFDNKYFSAPEDGINYLHIVFRNNKGWGEVAHYRIAVDSVPPSAFKIIAEKGEKTDYPRQKIFFETNDDSSGISEYVAQINNDAPITTKEPFYELPLLAPGVYRIKIIAKDFAGNATEEQTEIEVLPIASPKILVVSKDIFVGEGDLNIAGTALSNIFVNLSIKNELGVAVFSGRAESDATGNWSARFEEPLKKGRYYIEAISEDNRGAISLPSQSEKIYVRPKPIAIIFGIEITPLFFYLAIILFLIGGFTAYYLTYHFWRKQLERRVLIAQRDVINEFDSIEKRISKIMKKYEDKKITKVEIREIKMELKKIKNNIKNNKEYLIENIEEIND